MPEEEDGFSQFAWARKEEEEEGRPSVASLSVGEAKAVRRVSKVSELVSCSEPLVVTDAMVGWRRWTLEELAERFGDETAVANDRAPLQEWDCPPMRTKSTSIREYVAYARRRPPPEEKDPSLEEDDDNNNNNKGGGDAEKGSPWYLNSWAPFSKFHDLLEEWSYPYFVEDLLKHDETYQPQLIDYSKLFLGVPGCTTRLHFDNLETHAWLAQVQGRKQFVLFPPGDDDENLRLHHWEETRSVDGVRRAFDPATPPDPLAYPRLQALRGPYEVVVEPGEILLIPRGWWHYARCLDACVTLMRNFANSHNAVPFREAITRANDSAEKLAPRNFTDPALARCANCGTRASTKVKPCSRCRAVAYCGRDCQKTHFATHHKDVCRLLAEVKEATTTTSTTTSTTTKQQRDSSSSTGGSQHPSAALFATDDQRKKTQQAGGAARTETNDPTKTFAKAVLRPGKGRLPPDPDSMVRLHYDTYLADGQKVDSSRDKKPLDVHVRNSTLARGFLDAIKTMTVGERARVAVPPRDAYGARGVEGKVPPDTALVFDVELRMIF